MFYETANNGGVHVEGLRRKLYVVKCVMHPREEPLPSSEAAGAVLKVMLDWRGGWTINQWLWPDPHIVVVIVVSLTSVYSSTFVWLDRGV